MKKVLFGLLLLFNVSVFPETYFYKIDGTPISKEEHDLLYDIKLRNQFPMSLIHGQFQENELQAMQTELNDKVPGINVAFIPTTLYELFFIETFGKEEQDFKIDKSFPSTNEYVPGNFQNVNNNQKIKLLHFKLNQIIADYLKKYNYDITRQGYLIFFDDLSNNANNYWKKIYPYKNLDFDLLKKSIESEYKADQENNFLLYRGTNTIETSTLKNWYIFTENQSLSFGASLFSGMIIDTSATAYRLMHRFEKAYCLPINKKLYAIGELAKMFFIPELIDLASIYGDGEYFHPRSKMLKQQELVLGFDRMMTVRSRYEQLKHYYETDSISYYEIFKYIGSKYKYLSNDKVGWNDWLVSSSNKSIYPVLGLTAAYTLYYLKNLYQKK